MRAFNKTVTRVALWINNTVVGSVWTFAACVVFVAAIYVALFVQGYAKWNTSTGLFSNTLESSFELITGVGAVVAVVSLHKTTKKHNQEVTQLHKDHSAHLASLHHKIDKLTEKQR